MPTLPNAIPELRLQGGARLFMAAHSMQDMPQRGAHRYAFYALAWLSGGAASFVCDGQHYAVPSGSLVFMAPGQVHWWADTEPQAHLTLLGFVPEVFLGGLLDSRLMTDLPFFSDDQATVLCAPPDLQEALDLLFSQAARRYQGVAREVQNKTFLSLPRQAEGLLLAYLHAILAEAATHHATGAAPSLAEPQADWRLVRLFRLYMASSGRERHPVGHYAALLHVSADHLTRVVRRVTGKPPSEWLQVRLLAEAKRHLSFTDEPIERIAERLNFPTATQFSQWFRGQTGQTPRQFRQSVRQLQD